MGFGPVLRLPAARRILRRLAEWRVAEKLREIEPLLRPGECLLDIGCGNGVLCHVLRAHGWDVTPLDVVDGSLVPEVRPTTYDGRRIPFADDRFDVALLITVLHHVREPDALLAEATRVARRIIVIEEICESDVERLVTYAIDSVFNLEFAGHPRSNRSDAGWRAAFARLGLGSVSASYTRSLAVLRRVTYHAT